MSDHMSTQYRLVQSGKTASGSCSAGPRFVRACSATDLFIYYYMSAQHYLWMHWLQQTKDLQQVPLKCQFLRFGPHCTFKTFHQHLKLHWWPLITNTVQPGSFFETFRGQCTNGNSMANMQKICLIHTKVWMKSYFWETCFNWNKIHFW
jgi:hypothetical protein